MKSLFKALQTIAKNKTTFSQVPQHSWQKIRRSADFSSLSLKIISIITASSFPFHQLPIYAQTGNINPDIDNNFCLTTPDLMFILDDSGSVSFTERQQQRDAVMTMLNHFVDNNIAARAAIVRFSSSSSTVINYTNVTSATLSTFQTALNNNYGFGGLTDWESGFQAAVALGITPGSPDVTFFFTDGEINNGGSPDDEALQLKQVGSHIYGIGIQDPALTITDFTGVTDGPNTSEFNGNNAFTADYVPVSSFATLGAEMATLVQAMCPQGGSVAGTLYQDTNSDNTFNTGDLRLPANIEVQLLNSSGTVLSTVVTDGSGDFIFPYVPPGSNYQIQVVTSDPQIPSGLTISTINPLTGINITAGSTIVNQNFGFRLFSFDFGDAPDSYGDASHTITPSLYLGSTVPDNEADTQLGGDAGAGADGDDSDGTDDEDGVTLSTLNASATTYTIPAPNISVTNNTGGPATLHAWLDFDGNGTFEADEYTTQTVQNGNATPDGALTWSGAGVNGMTGGTTTYARFRITTDSNINANTPGVFANDGEVEDFAVVIPVASNPNVLLVKRITRVNGLTANGSTDLSVYVDDPSYPYDDNTLDNPAPTPLDTEYWPNPSTYLIGANNGGETRPGDEIEYTIYFLSTGNQTAVDVQLCDKVPSFQTFVPDAFNAVSAAPGGGVGANRGISVEYNGNLYSYTNDGDGDTAQYYPPGSTLPAACAAAPAQAEDNGAIVVNLGDLPQAIGSGTPTTSYGAIRFRAKVK